MNTHRILTRLLRRAISLALALVSGALATSALGQGTALQSIVWSGVPSRTIATGIPHPLAVSASSGLPVTLSVESGPATLGEGTLTVTGPGSVRVTAEQAGDTTYAGVRETRTFNGPEAVLTELGAVSFTGSPRGVKEIGNLAYVALGTRWNGQANVGGGVEVLDVSDPSAPVRLGRLSAAGWTPGAIDVSGHHAFVTYAPTTQTGASGVRVIDVSDPGNPVNRGSVTTAAFGADITVVGAYAYLATRTASGLSGGGLEILDVTDPTQPVRVGFFNISSGASGVRVHGTTAYLTRSNGGLTVVDVRDPARPERVGQFPAEVGFSNVDIAGTLAFVADHGYQVQGSASQYAGGLRILDLSHPARPALLGAVNLGDGTGGHVGVAGSLAFSVHWMHGLRVVDVSQPSRPVLVGSLARTGVERVFGATDRAYLLGNDGSLEIIGVRVAESQRLTWVGAGEAILELDTPHPIQATASSGLPVELRVDYGPGSILDGVLTITGPGTVGVTAGQAGDNTFAPVRETRTFNARQSIMTHRGGHDSRNLTHAVHVVGNRAYLADATGGIQVLDVTDPDRPVRLGFHVTGGRATDVQVVGNRAYVANGTPGLQILDVGNPAQIVRLGAFSTGGTALKVDVVGNLAYLATEAGRLQILDVSDPAAPTRVGRATHVGPALDVQVAGDRAYVAAGTFGLHIVDVSDPTTPVRVGGLTGLGEVTGLHVVGTLAYLATGLTGLQIVDVSDPATPVRRGGLDLFRDGVPGPQPWQPWIPGRTFAHAVEVVDGIAYVATERAGLQVVDVGDPVHPVRLGFHDTGDMAVGVHGAGDRVYVANSAAGVRVVEVRTGYPQVLTWEGATGPILDPGVPHPLRVTATSRLPVTLRVEAGAATLGEGSLTLTSSGTVGITAVQEGDSRYLPARETRLFNVAEVSVANLGRSEPDGQVVHLQVVGPLAYAVNQGTWVNERMQGGGLQVFDVSNPLQPVLLGNLGTTGEPTAVHVVGNIACLAAGSVGIHLIDVGDPTRMVRLSGLTTVGAASRVQVVENIAYVAYQGSGLQVLDVSDPARPLRRGSLSLGTHLGLLTDMHVSGGHAYITEVGWAPFGQSPSTPSLYVLDVSNPARPVRVGSLILPGQAYAVRVAGDFAYVSTGRSAAIGPDDGNSAGLWVVDVSDPTRPMVAGHFQPPNLDNGAYALDVSGRRVFMADPNGRVMVVDVSVPAQSKLVGDFWTGGWLQGQGLQVAGDRVYVGAGEMGVLVLEQQTGFPQTLHWTGIGSAIPALDVPYPLDAVASSGLPVSLRVISGPATLSEGWLTAHGPGAIQVVAEQAGDARHLPVREVRGFGLQRATAEHRNIIEVGGGARALQIVGNHAYVAAEGTWTYDDPFAGPGRLEGGGLRVVDVGNVGRPLLVGDLKLPGRRIEDLEVVGNRAYVVDYGIDTQDGIVDGGLHIVDVTQPANPVVLGRLAISSASRVSVSGNFVYVAGWPATTVVDASDPANPVGVGSLDRSSAALRVVGDRAYLLDSYRRFEVFDVSDPTRPVRLGGHDLVGWGSHVEIVGTTAYVTSQSGFGENATSQIEVFDVSDPTRPVRMRELNLMGARGMRVVGSIGYVFGSTGIGAGVQLLDLSQPHQPVLLGGFRTGGAWDVDVSGEFVYVLGSDLLEIFEAHLLAPQPLHLGLPGRLPFPGTPLAFHASSPSGLPVSLTVAGGPARIDNQSLVVTGLGPVTLRGEQAGDGAHLPASVEWTVFVHPPTPAMRLSGSRIELAWPAGLDGLRLQHRETVAPETPWRDLTGPTVQVGGEVRATIESPAPTGYFQLVHP
ncbi:MAG: hypothetical protein KF833_01675 [Verrucomicrobiae bacterium]|nr:hypothetical protein [Verrucomicrobiae bacterium]